MIRHHRLAHVLGSALLVLPICAMAGDGPAAGDWQGGWSSRNSDAYWGNYYREPEARLVEKYGRFAGSDENAQALIEGLRYDKAVQLSRNGTSSSFALPTDKMGYGNVNIALALAKASLADAGIRHPTPEQIRAALIGGTVSNRSGADVRLTGVLTLRASGMGWGQIAHKLGFKLGEVMRAQKDREHERQHADKRPDRHDHRRASEQGKDSDRFSPHAKQPKRQDFQRVVFERPRAGKMAGKPDRAETFGRAHHAERPERVEAGHRAERPQRIERPEKHARR